MSFIDTRVCAEITYAEQNTFHAKTRPIKCVLMHASMISKFSLHACDMQAFMLLEETVNQLFSYPCFVMCICWSKK